MKKTSVLRILIFFYILIILMIDLSLCFFPIVEFFYSHILLANISARN